MPAPGSFGPSVISGRVDSVADGRSVFLRLGSLRLRGEVLVMRVDGSGAVFAVEDVRRSHKSAFSTRVVYGNTNRVAPRLTICGGPFDSDSGRCRENVVVLASLVRADRGAAPPIGSPAECAALPRRHRRRRADLDGIFMALRSSVHDGAHSLDIPRWGT
jgi:hypothetical protein